MTQPSNIIRLDALIGPVARPGSAERPQVEPARVDSGRQPPAADASDLDNVIAFTRLRRDGQGENAVAVVAGGADRLVPVAAPSSARIQIIAFLICSTVVHGAFLAALNREPAPMASIGLETISVEIVLGSPAEAVAAAKPDDSQSTTTEPVTDPKAPERAAPSEQVAVAPQEEKFEPPMATEAPTSPHEPPPSETPRNEPVPSEPVVAAVPPPREAPTEPERAVEPAKPPDKPAVAPTKKPATTERIPDREHGKPRATHPTGKQAALAPAARPPNAAQPGRSDADTNYRGLAAAHLARFKQFPAEARSRGEQGSSLVTFSIDGNGRVTKVALVRGTGVASLDQESQAMVRRASPFPPPPGGHPVTITAPVSFHLR